jgi:hypothetical protein
MCETFSKNLQFSSISLSNYRVKGQNLGRVFNSGRLSRAVHNTHNNKTAYLKVENSAQPIWRFSPVCSRVCRTNRWMFTADAVVLVSATLPATKLDRRKNGSTYRPRGNSSEEDMMPWRSWCRDYSAKELIPKKCR